MRYSEFLCSYIKVFGNSKLFKGVYIECLIFMYRYCFYFYRKKFIFYSNYEILFLFYREILYNLSILLRV